MKARKKLFLSIIAGLGIILSIIIFGLFLLSQLINLDSTKKKIISMVSEKTGGQVNYAGFEFTLFPLPHVTISKGTFLVRDTARGSFENISVYPEVLPLLKGKVVPYRVRISSPEMTLNIPESDEQIGIKKRELSINEVWKGFSFGMISIVSKATNLVFEVNDGHMNLIDKGKTVFWFRDIQARIAMPLDERNIEIKCKSNLGEQISLMGSVNLKQFIGDGHVKLYNFQPAALYDYFLPTSKLRVSDSIINLDINFNADGQRHLNAEFGGSIPEFSVRDEKSKFQFRASNIEGEFQIDDAKTSISIQNIKLDNPNLNFRGSFLENKTSKGVDLIVQANEVDIKSVREAALFLVGQVPITQKIFEIIKGGYSPLTEFSSKAHSISELGKEQNFIIKGEIQNGAIFIPQADLDLSNARGYAIVSNGILEGKNLGANVGNSKGYNGNLKIGLGRENDIFKLDVLINGDLSELPPYLLRYVKNENVTKEISLVHNLKGNAQAHLILGDTKSSIKAKIEAREINLSANYKRIPYPIEINGGQFLYDKKRIDLMKLNLNLAQSSFAGLSAWVDWEKATDFNVRADESKISLNEMLPWLSSFENIGIYTKYLMPFNGSFNFSALNVEGPLSDAGEWNIRLKGEGILNEQIGPKLSLDLIKTPEEFVANSVTIDDEGSHATLNGKKKERLLQISFGGSLNRKTLGRIFSNTYLSDGWVKGDIRAEINVDEPAASLAEGNLKAESLISPMILDESFKINRISLEANKNQLNVKSLALSLGDTDLDIEGNVTSTEEGFQLMFDTTSDLIEWEIIKSVLYASDGEKNTRNGDEKCNLSLKGTIGLKAENFRYDRFNWSPFNAEIKFDDCIMNIVISDASLCGIDTLGEIRITPSRKTLDFALTSRKRQLDKTIRCLTEKENVISGDFDFGGQVTADVKNKLSAGSLQGNVGLSARDGRIYHDKFLLKILDIMRIVNLRLPDFGNKGLAYNSLDVKGKLKNGTLTLEDSILDSPTMAVVIDGDVDLADKKVDLKLKVAPIKIMNFATTKIPILKRIRGGHLLSIPFRIKGNWGDPEVMEDE